MRLLLSGNNPRDDTWSITVIDDYDKVVLRGNNVTITSDSEVQYLHRNIISGTTYNMDGRRAMLRNSDDIDNIMMDDWEYNKFRKLLRINR